MVYDSVCSNSIEDTRSIVSIRKNQTKKDEDEKLTGIDYANSPCSQQQLTHLGVTHNAGENSSPGTKVPREGKVNERSQIS